MATQQLGEEGFRWFIGLVEDINDPLKLGRARVRVLNEHDDDVLTEDIDWAHVMLPVSSSSVDGVGETPSLSVGTRVVGFFMDGNEKQMPMVLGSFPTIPDNDDNRHSLSWLARGKNTIDKEKLGPEPESPYKAEYPFNKTITTRSGHAIELDDTPENERVHIYHKSGAYIEINNKGQLVYKSMADSFELVAQNKELFVKGDLSANIQGNAVISVKGNVTLKASHVTIDSPSVNMTGDVFVEGDVFAQGEVTGNGVKLSTHRHGGVDSGSSTTSGPV